MRLSKAEQVVFDEWAESFREYNRLVGALTWERVDAPALTPEQYVELKAKLIKHRDVSVRLVATLDVNRVPDLISDSSATLEQVLQSRALPAVAETEPVGDK